MRLARLTLWMVATAVASAAHAGYSCSGEACQDRQHTFENGCHVIRNTGGRKIRMTIGAISKTLAPGETWRITNPFGSGECLPILMGDETATYVD